MEFIAPHVADHFFVLYDAGETNGLLPVLQKFECEGKSFKVLVMGTAETIIKPGMFKANRLVLPDFNVSTIVDNTKWQREQKLDPEDILKICNGIKAQMAIVGTASKIQQQILKQFNGEKIAFCDNFDYDPSLETFQTVKGVLEETQTVLCPSKNVVDLLSENLPKKFKYEIVGKPSLEQWTQELVAVDKDAVLNRLGFDANQGPIVLFVAGYRVGYEKLNPLFEEAAQFLCEHGCQVMIQPHPKSGKQVVKTSEALAISDYVVGFSSSVIFDAAIIGKKAIYFFPDSFSFKHFAIEKGYLPKATSKEELLEFIKDFKEPINLYEVEQIPYKSIERITNILVELSK